MAAIYETDFAIRSLAIVAGNWTDLAGSSIPIDCNYIMVFNDSGQDISLRSDPNNASSQATVHDGQMFTIGAPRGVDQKTVRFQKGRQNPVASLQPSVSSVNVLLFFIF